MNLQGLIRALVAGGACLALIAPSAGARPIAEPPVPVATTTSLAPVPAPQLQRLIRDDRGGLAPETASPQPTSGGFDWAIAGAGFAGVLGLVAISRFTRTRVKELSNV